MAELRIPHRGPDQPTLDAIDDLRHSLDGTERQVVRHLLSELLFDGSQQTMGEVLDTLEAATPQERRAAVDRARAEAGLESLGTVEFDERVATASSEPPRDHLGQTPAICCVCGRREPDREIPNAFKMTDARRWACPEHESQGDFTKYTGARLVYGPTGDLVDLDERDRDRQRAETEAKHRRAQREARRVERRREAEERDEVDRARLERHRRETPRGMWTP